MTNNFSPYDYNESLASEPFAGLPPSYRQPLFVTLMLQSSCLGFVLSVAESGLTISRDIANSLGWDIKLALRSDWRNPRTILMNTCYYTTRWWAFCFALTAVLSITITQEDCTILPRLYGVFAMLTIITCSAVFAWRVIALWAYEKRIMAILALFFLVEAGFACSTLVKSGGQHVPFSPYCYAEYNARPWLAGNSIAILCFDSVVAALTIYKLTVYSRTNPLRFARDGSVPPLSRLLIQQGVIYYIIASLTNLTAVIFFFLPLAPERALLHVMWTIPGLSIQSCMAAKVFRLIRKELAAPHIVPRVSGLHPTSSQRSSPDGSPQKSFNSTAHFVPTLSRPQPAAHGVVLSQHYDSYTEKVDARFGGPRAPHRFAIYPPDMEKLASEDDHDHMDDEGGLAIERRPSAPFADAVMLVDESSHLYASRASPA